MFLGRPPADLIMTDTTVRVTDLDKVKDLLANVIREAPSKFGLKYLDVRLEAAEGIGSLSEDGHPKITSADWSLAIGVRAIVNSVGAAGFDGRQLGVKDLANFNRVLKNSLKMATLRAKSNAKNKTLFIEHHPDFAKSLGKEGLAPISVHQDNVAAEYEVDPRMVTGKQMTQLVCEAAAVTLASHPYIKRVELIANTGISRQIFASSEGALIDQWSCSSGTTVFVIAHGGGGNKPVDLYHHTGNQLGLEVLTKAKNTHQKTIDQFALQIAKEAVELVGAKPAPETKKPVTVVLDPDLVALFAHEIIGHPSELDRALKMEAGYAGRSWFLADLEHNMIGKQVGSSILTAFSDPTLRGGYGYYKYDDEGTPAKRVYHIKNGTYRDFMNSRQTAPLIGAQPNGHYKANSASAVPLIRMSASAIAPGNHDPKQIIADVDHGYYCVGHRIPSISESRENFQIAPRLIYEIRNGKIGQVYRDGRLTANSRDFFMSIDALGNDFQIFAIPNCGKGQPMQAKQVGNGGPTARSKANIATGI